MAAQIDAETQALVIALMLQDIEEQNSTFKGGKGHNDSPVPDDELAWELQQLELNAATSVLDDRRIALELSRALESDADLIRTLESRENFERQDRAVAITFEQGGELPEGGLRIPSPPPPEEDADDTDSTAA
jgi:hypothetical protein